MHHIGLQLIGVSGLVMQAVSHFLYIEQTETLNDSINGSTPG